MTHRVAALLGLAALLVAGLALAGPVETAAAGAPPVLQLLLGAVGGGSSVGAVMSVMWWKADKRAEQATANHVAFVERIAVSLEKLASAVERIDERHTRLELQLGSRL